ncbi:hypothetical protein O9K51_06969 [Purpureocillium lavendulum]|uniref:Uncharacterized protein n=1 Tax=Purpureocillium lavendulum TaxID=1247861 RepID=A0AB34FP77_9HYPO|nr:hypothetical protein O9K51_06969 [Purpureocillium lavendulum]
MARGNRDNKWRRFGSGPDDQNQAGSRSGSGAGYLGFPSQGSEAPRGSSSRGQGSGAPRGSSSQGRSASRGSGQQVQDLIPLARLNHVATGRVGGSQNPSRTPGQARTQSRPQPPTTSVSPQGTALTPDEGQRHTCSWIVRQSDVSQMELLASIPGTNFGADPLISDTRNLRDIGNGIMRRFGADSLRVTLTLTPNFLPPHLRALTRSTGQDIIRVPVTWQDHVASREAFAREVDAEEAQAAARGEGQAGRVPPVWPATFAPRLAGRASLER